MELLIPGLLLVALMVYASTRIKKTAARAFEAEQIDNDDFTLSKPDGFLNRIGDDSGLAFEAYSKEFGPEPAEDIRAATAVVVIETATIDDALAKEKERLSTVVSEERFEIDGGPAALLSGELERDGHLFNIACKIIERNDRTLVLRIEVLKELIEDFARKTDEMLTTFSAK
jgi:hypothetical protein